MGLHSHMKILVSAKWNWTSVLKKKKKKRFYVSLGKMWYVVANSVHSFVLALPIIIAVFLAYFILLDILS